MKRLIFVFFAIVCMILVQCDQVMTTGPGSQSNREEPTVFMELYGHSSVRIVTPDSLQIITDPFGNSISNFYQMPDSLAADIVTVSHSHADHNQVQTVQGDPLIINTAGSDTIGSVIITGYLSKHGRLDGSYMGTNIIFVFQIGEIKIVHLGENRNVTETEILSAIHQADVLIAPVGEIASLSFGELEALVQDAEIGTVIPTHCSLDEDNLYYSSSTLDEYIASLPEGTSVVYQDSLEIVANMPNQVVVLRALYAK